MRSLAVRTPKSTPPPPSTTKPKSVVAARDVAALVPMPELLDTLGIRVCTRTRRGPCLLHNGSNPTAFSWRDDGVWFCFHCGRGGDKLSLVQAVRKCNFLNALRFLAALSGIEWSSLNTDEVRRQLAEAKKKAEHVKAATKKLQRLEKHLVLDARKEVLSLHRLRRNAGARLDAIRSGAQPRFTDEEVVAWDALALVAGQELRAAARYTFLGFASVEALAHFVLNPRERERIIDEVLISGVVVDEKGRVMEVAP